MVIRCRKDSAPRDGSALMVALWIILLLAIMIGTMSVEAQIQSRIASYYHKRTKAQDLARSGIEIAEMLMHKAVEVKGDDPGSLEAEEDSWFAPARRLSTGLAVYNITAKLGQGEITVDIVPEPALRNVNKLTTADDWEPILEVAGIPEEMWPVLIESALDWLDKDSNPRTDGAETEDYYETLDPPYESKNGPMDTVGELLLVRGFNSTILDGGVTNFGVLGGEAVSIRGIRSLLTTYGDGKVNVNAASSNVLRTLPDLDEYMAADIIAEREGAFYETETEEDFSFKSESDFMSRIDGLSPSLSKLIATDSAIYNVRSRGTVLGVQREVWCIAEYSKKQMKILQWREGE